MPDAHLVREELRVVLRVEVRLCRLGRVQLQSFANALAQDVKRWIGFHNLAHSLLHERLHSGRPISVRGVHRVSQIDGNENTSAVETVLRVSARQKFGQTQRYSRRWVDTHVVRAVVEELGTSVTLNIVRVKVTCAGDAISDKIRAH